MVFVDSENDLLRFNLRRMMLYNILATRPHCHTMLFPCNTFASQAYSEPCKTSKMVLFAKIFNSWLFHNELHFRYLTGFWLCLCIYYFTSNHCLENLISGNSDFVIFTNVIKQNGRTTRTLLVILKADLPIMSQSSYTDIEGKTKLVMPFTYK